MSGIGQSFFGSGRDWSEFLWVWAELVRRPSGVGGIAQLSLVTIISVQMDIYYFVCSSQEFKSTKKFLKKQFAAKANCVKVMYVKRVKVDFIVVDLRLYRLLLAHS